MQKWNLYLVPRPWSSERICLDYHTLNGVTEPNTLPRVDNILDPRRVIQAKFIIILNLVNGYWQVPVPEVNRSM